MNQQDRLNSIENSELMQLAKMGNPDKYSDYQKTNPGMSVIDVENMVKDHAITLASSSDDPDGAIAREDLTQMLTYAGVESSAASKIAEADGLSAISGIDVSHKTGGEALGATAKNAWWNEMKGMSAGIGFLLEIPELTSAADKYQSKVQSNPVVDSFGGLGDLALSSVQPAMSTLGFIATNALLSWLPGGLGLTTAAKVGAKAAKGINFVRAGLSQAGNTMYDVSQMEDALGNKIDMTTVGAKMLSTALVVTMGGVELWSLNQVPGYSNLTKYFTGQEIKKHISKGIIDSVGKYTWDSLKSTASEGIEEGVQLYLSKGYENLLKEIKNKEGAEFEMDTLEAVTKQAITETVEATKSMFLSSFILGGATTGVYNSRVKAESKKNFDTTKTSQSLPGEFLAVPKKLETKDTKESTEKTTTPNTEEVKKITPIKGVVTKGRFVPINEAENEKAREAQARGAQVVEIEVEDNFQMDQTQIIPLANKAAIQTGGKIVGENRIVYESEDDLNKAVYLLKNAIIDVDQNDTDTYLTIRNEDGTYNRLELGLASEEEMGVDPDLSYVENPEAPYQLSRMTQERALEWTERETIRKAIGDVSTHTGGNISSTDLEANIDAVILVAKTVGISTDELLKKNLAFELVTEMETPQHEVGNANISYETDIAGQKKYTITINKTANVGSLVHEVGHLLRGLANKEQLQDFVNHYGSGKTAIWLDDIVKTEDGKFSLGEKVYNSYEEAKNVAAKYEETFANDFVTYIKTGEAPTTELQNIFRRMKAVLQQVFNRYGYKLDDEVVNAFNRLFSNEGNFKETVTKENIPDKNNTLYQIAYQGTVYNFDKYDLKKVGTGEGNQSYGHGFYFTQTKGLAKEYAKRIANDKLQQSNSWQHLYKLDGVEQDFRNEKNGSKKYYFVKAIETIGYHKFEYKKDKKKCIEIMEFELELANRYISSETQNAAQIGGIKRAIRELKTKKLFDRIEEPDYSKIGNMALYNVDIPDDGFIEWFDKVPIHFEEDFVATQKERIQTLYDDYSLEEMKDYFGKTKEEMVKVEEEELAELSNDILDPDMIGEVTFQTFHDFVKETIEPEDISKILLNMGYKGVHYQTTFEGETNDNFVVFDEDDIKIKSRTNLNANELFETADSLINQTEFDNIKNQFKDTDTWLKAPNGKTSNLTEKQWVQVRTQSFKNWFGDWENDPSSIQKEALDLNGEPEIFYHGSYTDDIEVFKLQSWQGYANSRSRGGFSFTNRKDRTRGYATPQEKRIKSIQDYLDKLDNALTEEGIEDDGSLENIDDEVNEKSKKFYNLIKKDASALELYGEQEVLPSFQYVYWDESPSEFIENRNLWSVTVPKLIEKEFPSLAKKLRAAKKGLVLRGKTTAKVYEVFLKIPKGTNTKKLTKETLYLLGPSFNVSEENTGAFVVNMPDNEKVAYVAKSSMIKSTENNGAFNPNNENILFETAAPKGSTPFKNWFGKSKVVDENGEPLVVYHQTNTKFTEFDLKNPKSSKSDFQTPIGIFLKATSKDIGVDGDIQMALYARIENPLTFKNRNEITKYFSDSSKEYKSLVENGITIDEKYGKKLDKEEEILDSLYAEAYPLSEKDPKRTALKEQSNESEIAAHSILDQWKEAMNQNSTKAKAIINKILVDKGYDGMILEEDEGSFNRKIKTYIALQSNQVKSLENNGEFNPNNDNILYETVENKVFLEDRVAEEELDEYYATIEDIRDHGGHVDIDGYVTVYHRTSSENAYKILKDGYMIAKEDGLFFSTKKDGQNMGYGKAVVNFEIPIDQLEMDDIFDDEIHFRMPIKYGEEKDISKFLPTKTENEKTYLERNEVIEKYRNTNKWLKAPNGVDSNLGEDLWIKVRTKSFKNWFGDWENDPENSSKILDENGEPLIAFHGARKANFTEFDNTLGNRQSGAIDYSSYFSSSISTAHSYSGTYNNPVYDKDYDENGLYRVFLNIKDPGEYEFDGADWNGNIFDKTYIIDSITEERINNPNGDDYFNSEEEALEYISENGWELDEDVTIDVNPWIGFSTDYAALESEENGKDGAILHNVVDNGHFSDAPASDVFVTFNANQIKSIDNNGEWNRETNNILFEKAAPKGSKTFKTWFGKSKVVDENGNPLLVFHGTQNKKRFTTFEATRGFNINGIYHASSKSVASHWSGTSTISRFKNIGDEFEKLKTIKETVKFIEENFGDKVEVEFEPKQPPYDINSNDPWLNKPIAARWIYDIEYSDGMSSNGTFGNSSNLVKTEKEALEALKRMYSSEISVAENPTQGAGTLYANYLKIENPLEVDAKGESYHNILFNGERVNTETLANVAKEQGFDGVIVKNVKETDYENILTDDYIVFDSKQIKSQDNNGSFDSNNANILYENSLGLRWHYPKVRGGWTKEKIIRDLKSSNHRPQGVYSLSREIVKFDDAQDLRNHIYYHGTGSYLSGGIKPSIVFSDKRIEEIGGGGYGEKYWGFSVSKKKRISETFSGIRRSVSIYPVILDKNAKVIERLDLEDAADLENEIVQLWTDGVDAVWIGGGEEELVVLNPYAIHVYNHSEVFNVFGGFKSKETTLEQAETIYNRAKEINKLSYKERKETSQDTLLFEKADTSKLTINENLVFEDSTKKVLDTKEKIAAHNTVVELKQAFYDKERLTYDVIDSLNEVEKILLDGEELPSYNYIEEDMEKLGESRTVQEIFEEQLESDNEIENFMPEMTVFDLAIQSKGITKDVNEAGYILPDGRMLDFSGKNNGGPAGQRAEDHRTLGLSVNEDLDGSDMMVAFQKLGAIRIDFRSGLIDMETLPTSRQFSIIKDLIIMNDEIYVDLQDGDNRSSISNITSPNKIIGLIRRFYAKKQTLLFETVNHGSPYSYDKMTTKKMGEGEGNQAFGWGMYLTQSKTVAKEYANATFKSKVHNLEENPYKTLYKGKEIETFNDPRDILEKHNDKLTEDYFLDMSKYLIMEEKRDWMGLPKANSKASFVNEIKAKLKEHLATETEDAKGKIYSKISKPEGAGFPGLDEFMEGYLKWEETFDENDEEFIKYKKTSAERAERNMSKWGGSLRNSHLLKHIEEGMYEDLTIEAPNGIPGLRKTLYRVEIPDEGYLQWYEKGSKVVALSKDFIDYISTIDPETFKERKANARYKGDVDVESLSKSIEEVLSEQETQTFEAFYNCVSWFLSERFTSELLNEMGYVGIKYPVMSMSKNSSKTESNYVIFNDDDVKIIERRDVETNTLYELSDEAKNEVLENRKADVKKAIEDYYWIPDSVLKEYETEDWAINEIKFRSYLKDDPSILEEAKNFIDENEFLEHIQTSEGMEGYKWVEEDEKWFKRVHAYSRILTPKEKDAQFIRMNTVSQDKLVSLANKLRGYEDVSEISGSNAVVYKWGAFDGISPTVKNLSKNSTDADFEKAIALIEKNPSAYRKALQVIAQANDRVGQFRGTEEATGDSQSATRDAYYDSLGEELVELINPTVSESPLGKYSLAAKKKSLEAIIAEQEEIEEELKKLGAETEVNLEKTKKDLSAAKVYVKELEETLEEEKTEIQKLQTKLEKKSIKASQASTLARALKDRRARVKTLRTDLTEQNQNVRKLTKKNATLTKRIEAKKVRVILNKMNARIKKATKFNSATIDAKFEDTFNAIQRLFSSRESGPIEFEDTAYLTPQHTEWIRDGKMGKTWTLNDLILLDESVKAMRADGRYMLDTKKANRSNRLQNVAMRMYQQTYGTMPEVSPTYGSIMNDIIEELMTKQHVYKENVFNAMLNTVKASIGKMQRVARVLDGNVEGVMYDLLVRQAYDHMTEELRESYRRLEDADAKMNELKITPNGLVKEGFKYTSTAGQEITLTKSEVIGLYVYSQNDLGLQKLIHVNGNNINEYTVNKAIATLTDNEKAWGDYMIDSLGSDESWSRQADVFYNVYNKNLGKRDRYFTFVGSGSHGDEGKADLINGTKGTVSRYVDKSFTHEVNPNAVYPLKLNVTSTFTSQVKKQEHFINWAEWVRDINFLMDKGAIGRIIEMEHGPKFKKVVEDYVNDVGSPQTLMDDLDRLGSKVISNAAVAALSLNFLTMLKQLPSFSAAVRGDVGMVELLSVATRLMNPTTNKEAVNFIHEMSPYMRKRAISVEVEKYGATDFDTKAGRLVSTFNEKIGMKGIFLMDQIAVNTLWLASYDTYLRRNPKNLQGDELKKEAAFKATQLISESQPTSIINDLSSLQRKKGPFVRSALLFTNQMFQYVNMVWYDIPTSMKAYKATKDPQYMRKAFGSVMNMAISGALIILVSGAAFRKKDEDDDEYLKRMTVEVLKSTANYSIPLAGSAIAQGASGYSSGSIIQLPTSIGRLLGTDFTDLDKVSDRLCDILFDGGSITGLPTAFINRAIKSVKNENVFELLGTNYGRLWENR